MCVLVCVCVLPVCHTFHVCAAVLVQIERPLLEETVKTLNSFYREAERISGHAYLEGCLACATAYIIYLCLDTRYEKVHTHTHSHTYTHTHSLCIRHLPLPRYTL